jgi:hybrid cluster-associated redox disulfide protein
MWLTYVALGVGLIGLLMAWSARRKNKDLRERIAQTNSRVYGLRRQLEETAQQAEQERMQLKFQLLKLQGELKVTPDMKIGEVLTLHPQAGQVLAAFHLGGCSSCAVDPGQSLNEAAVVNGRELEPILVALNNLVAEDADRNGHVSPERLKTSNVQLMF